jgi:hypothetical protein
VLDIEQVIERWRKAWEFEAFERPLPLPETINAICEELAFSLESIGCKEEEIALLEEENAKLRAVAEAAKELRLTQTYKKFHDAASQGLLIIEAAAKLDQAIAAWNRRAGGWIPVKERLPGKGECLVVHTDGTVHPASVIFGEDFKHCTHWMPLPKPSEGGAHNG